MSTTNKSTGGKSFNQAFREARKDVRQQGNTTVNTSEGDINAKRSQGRKTGVTRRLISKTGRKDNSNK